MSQSRLPQSDRPHMLVRLKPYDPPTGAVSISKSISGVSFDEGDWVPVYLDKGNPDPFLECLRAETQEVTGGPLCFDVCTPAEAAEIRRRERMASLDKPLGQGPAKPVPPPPGDVDAGGYTPLNEPAPEHVLDLPPEVIAEEAEEPTEESSDEPPPVPDVPPAKPLKSSKPTTRRRSKRRSKTTG